MKAEDWIKSQRRESVSSRQNPPIPQGQPQIPPQGQPQQIMLDPSDLEDVKCECGSEYFKVEARLKRLSPLHPKNLDRQERFFPVRVLLCSACGKEKEGINV